MLREVAALHSDHLRQVSQHTLYIVTDIAIPLHTVYMYCKDAHTYTLSNMHTHVPLPDRRALLCHCRWQSRSPTQQVSLGRPHTSTD